MRTYLVKFHDVQAGMNDLHQKAKAVERRYHHLSQVVVLSLTDEEASRLQQHPNVLWLEPDHLVTASAVQTEAASAPVKRSMEQVCAFHAHQKGVSGKGVRVALLDTGIAEAQGLTVAGGVSFVSAEPEHGDLNGHGTHIAALIASEHSDPRMASLAPGAELYAVKVLDRCGNGTVSALIAGIEWAIDQGMHIVSISAGSRTESRALEEAIEAAYVNGLLLVAAAGNEADQHDVNEPARSPFVLAVGAVDSDNAIAKFSNRGRGIDLFAPGVAVRSQHLNDQWAKLSGTSVSVAYVTGAAALLKGNDPLLTAAQLRGFLCDSATPLADDAGTGAGLVNAYGALHLAELAQRTSEEQTMHFALRLGEAHSAWISRECQDDMYQWVAGASEALELTLTVPAGADYDLFVYAAALNVIGMSTRGVSEAEVVRVNVSAGESYYAKVFGFGGCYDASAPYALLVTPYAGDELEGNDSPETATPIRAGQVYPCTIHSAVDTDWFVIEAEADRALEVELRNLPPGTEYDLEIYNAEGERLAGSLLITDRWRVAICETQVSGSYYVKVFSRQGFDVNHRYELDVDMYRVLSGVVTDRLQVTAADGPYMIGENDLYIADGALVDVEPGTILSVRGGRKIFVQAGGVLNLVGEANRPVCLIGATGADDVLICRELLREQEDASLVYHQQLTVQYDQYEVGVTAKSGTDVPPSQRPGQIKQFYLDASPYQFSVINGMEFTGTWYHPVSFTKRDLYLGLDVEMFAQWEVDSGRISDERFARGEVNYWEYVNSHFAKDMAEAVRVSEAGGTADNYRVQAMVDYLKEGKRWKDRHGCLKGSGLMRLLNPLELIDLHQHVCEMGVSFWWSHNASIVYWDKRAREEGLHEREDVYEALFINGVIIRLDFASDLPLGIPLYGNNIPPVGLLGFFLHHGPMQYPSVYPAPAPAATVDFEHETVIGLVKAYWQLLKEGTNPVFTWGLPTPADTELAELFGLHGITLESSSEDWKRFLQPALRTIREIEEKYMQPRPLSPQPAWQGAVRV